MGDWARIVLSALQQLFLHPQSHVIDQRLAHLRQEMRGPGVALALVFYGRIQSEFLDVVQQGRSPSRQ